MEETHPQRSFGVHGGQATGQRNSRQDKQGCLAAGPWGISGCVWYTRCARVLRARELQPVS